jgi:hypothetical protein
MARVDGVAGSGTAPGEHRCGLEVHDCNTLIFIKI